MGSGGKSYKIIYEFIFSFLSIIFLFITTGYALPIGLTANWQYSWDHDKTTTKSFFQSYSMDFNKFLNPVISFSGNMRYTRIWREGNVDELLAPLLNFGLNNDLFRFYLSASGSDRRSTGTPTYSYRSLSAVWSSNWRKKWIPNLMFTIGKNWNYDNSSPRTMDITSKYFGTNVSWSYLTNKIYYNFNWNKTQNYVYDTESTTKNHFVRFQTSHNFFENRLSMYFSQQFMYTSSTSYATPISGTTYIKQIKIDNIEANSTTALTAAPYLIDGITKPTTTSGTSLDVPAGSKATIFIQYIYPQSIGLIYVYTYSDISSFANSFVWDIYTSSDGITWTKVITGAQFTYDKIQQRFEISTGTIKSQYIKVVMDQPVLYDYYITEVQTYQVISSANTTPKFTTISRSYITNLTLSYKITPNLIASYNLYWRRNIVSKLPTYKNIINSASLNWKYSKYFSPTFSISENINDNGVTKNRIRTYSISNTSQFLPTLYTNIIASRSDNYKDSSKQSTTNYITLTTGAQIYPDLSTTLRVGYSDTRNYLVNTTVTDILNCGLDITMRLTPKLTLGYNGNYNEIVRGTGSDSYTNMVNLTWRPSAIFSFKTNYYRTWSEGSETTDGAGASITLAPTHKTQMSIIYNWSNGSANMQRVMGSFSWTISNHFNLNLNGSYTKIDDKNAWTANGQFVARF